MARLFDRFRRIAGAFTSHASSNDEDDRFVLHDRLQISSLLRRMIDQRSPVSAPVPGNGPALLTTVLELTNDEMILDASPDPAVERLALQQDELHFSTRIDRVDVRFPAGPLKRTVWERLPAYVTALPRRMRYMQRREYFRVDIPIAHSVSCQALVSASEDVAAHEFRTRVNDISVGGLAMLIPFGEERVVVPGAHFTCHLSLPDSPPILVGVRVRRLFRGGHRSGVSKNCAGCEFIDLSPAAETAIQRYMMRLERERIARERGEV